MPRKNTGRKQGNQGHFHGEPLQLLESFAQAYVDAGMNKSLFWKDFWLAWYKEYPPLPQETSNSLSSANDASASASAANDASANAASANDATSANAASANDATSAKDTSANDSSASARAANDGAECTSSEDPDVKNARAASRQKIKSWFSNRATKFKNREKNPFLHYLRRLDKKLIPPRLVPLHKFFMQLPQYSAEVEARYQQQYVQGGGDKDVEDNEEEEEVDQLDEDEDEDLAGKKTSEQEGEKDDSRGGAGDVDDNGEADDEEGGQGSKDPREKNLALSRRVKIASLIYDSKPKEVKEEVARLRQADFEERKKKYDASLSGDDLFDEALVPKRRNYIALLTQPFLDALAKMTKTTVSLSVAAIEDTPERKDSLFARHIQSNNVSKKFSDWNPDSFRDQYVKSFITYVQAMTELNKENSVSNTAPPVSGDVLQTDGLLKFDEEEQKAGSSATKGQKRGRDTSESASTSQRKSKKRKGKGKGKGKARKRMDETEESAAESGMSVSQSSESEEDEPPAVLRRSTRGRKQASPLLHQPKVTSLEESASAPNNATPTSTPQPLPQLSLENDLVGLSSEEREKHLARYGEFNPYWYNIVRGNALAETGSESNVNTQPPAHHHAAVAEKLTSTAAGAENSSGANTSSSVTNDDNVKVTKEIPSLDALPITTPASLIAPASTVAGPAESLNALATSISPVSPSKVSSTAPGSIAPVPVVSVSTPVGSVEAPPAPTKAPIAPVPAAPTPAAPVPAAPIPAAPVPAAPGLSISCSCNPYA
ncbi:hypothetical protein F5880DRAFT_1616830 [Lentinula raphanica]|nr:hypothetical protein F5880DRAFT_1616830 [Lentinula raphanica]